ncbi:uncharacterized protein LOC108916323 [Anoplophora glabripennis]|uniref:uncharacterized protein LOC108916323 n=1 Tax=Anoplophora glabripennis TaxID=217634 RepID=UPI0008736136|nr:uncharacterized protein LOC108916323 [Anoplophora glabripennis]
MERMKIPLVLSGLLMLTTLTYCQEKCRKEGKKTWYYVHRANIRIPTYYCFHNPEQDSPCGNNAEVKPPSQEIFRHCTSEAANLPGKKFQHILCELPAHLDLLEGTVKFEGNMTCPYQKGLCYNTNLSKNIFWMKKYTCENLVIIHRNYFNVWTFGQNETKFIKNEHVSLLLTKKFKLCGVEMWKTDYEGIVVSENNATMLETQNKQKLNSILIPKECDITIQNKQIPTKPPKVWFVYKYPTNVTVYFCVATPKNSCGGGNFDEITPENNSHLLSRCGSSFGMSQQLNVVCKKNMKIDFEKDQVTGLSLNCKYSEGLCLSNKTFWSAIDSCGAFHSTFKGYEELCEGAKCLIQEDRSRTLSLRRQGFLCDAKVWYVDQNHSFVTEKKISNPKTEIKGDSLRNAIYEHRKEIGFLQKLLNYMILILIICGGWYLLNVVINFTSLVKSRKSRTRGKVCFINCISQSLTMRYLRFHQEENASRPLGARESSTYASVENELYCKRDK